MTDLIHIGQVSVPAVDYAVGAAAVLGIRDSGKTVTSKGIAEQLLDRGIPVIVFDAVGKWRWLKVPGESGHRSGKGYKVVVAGGRAPDLALTPQSVPHIVRSALKERIPLVIDLYDKALSKADWRRIVQQAIRIIHYENEGGAVHVFLEEAAEFAPQKVIDGEVYAEVEKLVRMGGNASVGITLINQRSQEVNKAVLDNCTTLILGCQVGSKAIEAVSKWVDRLDSDTATEVTQSLPKLTAGEAWVWTRQNPDKPHRIKAPMCRSFHPDRRTPEVVLNSTTSKATDTAAFVAQLTASIPKVIEEAKANDPAELKKQLAQLKAELAKAQKAQAPANPVEVEKPVEVPVFTDADRARLIHINNDMIEASRALKALQEGINEKFSQFDRLNTRRHVSKQKPSAPARVAAYLRPDRSASSDGKLYRGDQPLGKCARAILTTLVHHAEPMTRRRVALSTGYSISSGGFSNALSELRSAGAISSVGTDLCATSEASTILGEVEPLPTGEDLRNYWFAKLSKCAREILRYLCSIYPDPSSRQSVAEVTGYSVDSGGFSNALSELRGLELIADGPDRSMTASEELFE